jgi:hypothetical protein
VDDIADSMVRFNMVQEPESNRKSLWGGVLAFIRVGTDGEGTGKRKVPWFKVVVSHPFDEKKSNGWGTGAFSLEIENAIPGLKGEA